VLGVEARGQALQAQRLAGAGLVDHQRRDATLGEPGGQAHQVLHLLGRVQPVELHQDRRALARLQAFGRQVERRQVPAFVGNLDALDPVAHEP
jgi:hypothetical protein